MLSSPAFGERMSTYWLDLVRYADTVGYHGDQDVSISPFRDYVIDAFNSNKPFDEFTREQLAGDLLPNPTKEQLVASGYNKLGMMSAEGGVQPEEYLAKYAADRVRTASSVWLGSTLACAECHDHKFDPFTTKDFYRFAAFFADIKERGLYAGADKDGGWGPTVVVEHVGLKHALQPIEARIAELEAQLAEDTPELAASESRWVAQQELQHYRQQREQLVASHSRTTLITVAVEPREMRVLPRGNWMDKSGQVVSPGVPHFLKPISGAQRPTRLDLANWMVAPDNPLTARTFVNRLWKLYFGTGLSKTLDDLGSQGEPPSHPQLLDNLAVEFIESGWDVKHIIKTIVMSSAYRQSSLMRDELKQVDPYNRLLARQSRYRLDAELVRDNALAVSGLLVRRVGGRSVKPYQPDGLYQHLNFPPRTYEHDVGANQFRRGVYTHLQRQFLHPAMQSFDAPAREECTAERPRSNTPLAALVLLNDPSYVEAARRLAENGIASADAHDGQRLQWMMNRALSRDATDRELEILNDLLAKHRQFFKDNPQRAERLVSIGLSKPLGSPDPVELAAWTSVSRAVLNMHELITRY
jgi:hypothetical protein